MGEMADDLYDRMMDDMDGFGDGFYCRRPRVHHDPWRVTCRKCGMRNLKWRLDTGGTWTLYENERVEHNRLKPHVCVQDIPTAEGFEDVE